MHQSEQPLTMTSENHLGKSALSRLTMYSIHLSRTVVKSIFVIVRTIYLSQLCHSFVTTFVIPIR